MTESQLVDAVPGGEHYPRATQITPANVHALEQAWVYRTGDMREMGRGTLDGVEVDLAEGLGDFAPQDYSVTSPPAILRDLLITGAMVLDRTHDHMPSGVVRADERQFVVIAAGGHFGMPQEPKGDYLIAFALPRNGGEATRHKP